MTDFRINTHPILSVPERRKIPFTWNKKPMEGIDGDTIASALIANGIRIFGYHHKDGSPQGIFCANGQCAQCMVLVDGTPLKSCMEFLKNGVDVMSMDGLPVLPKLRDYEQAYSVPELSIPVLIIGGGPAGLSAAIELSTLGIETLLIDDKDRLGGKLVLQTHRFFGSLEAVYAGTRGVDIAACLEEQLKANNSITTWSRSTAVAVFSDKKVGILRNNEYILVKPDALLISTGAREKSLVFPGNTLPGVYGAGAFQTLVNRDLIRPASTIFIVGGGNVGLIAGYHALQAGIQVAGLVEALPECGGYRVHRDKLLRLGVPIYESHTIISANGRESVESITIAKIDHGSQIQANNERTYPCDTILVAVGLSPIDEFYRKALTYGIPAYIAGDAEEIAEASAAIFSGKIAGRKIARELRESSISIPDEWGALSELLKSKPGSIYPGKSNNETSGFFPVIHCLQEIPCDPCVGLCPNNLIKLAGPDLIGIPEFTGAPGSCSGCGRCVIGCPGLAITLIDYRKDVENPTVTIPYEFDQKNISLGDQVFLTDRIGEILGLGTVSRIRSSARSDHTSLVEIKSHQKNAEIIAGFRTIRSLQENKNKPDEKQNNNPEIVCRCERVSVQDIQKDIENGIVDLNELKAITRAGFGACGSKTCHFLLLRLMTDAGIKPDRITDLTARPFYVEIPLGAFSPIITETGEGDDDQ